MVKGIITSAIKKVTLELIYQVVNERTQDLKNEIGETRDVLNTKISGTKAELKAEISEIRSAAQPLMIRGFYSIGC